MPAAACPGEAHPDASGAVAGSRARETRRRVCLSASSGAGRTWRYEPAPMEPAIPDGIATLLRISPASVPAVTLRPLLCRALDPGAGSSSSVMAVSLAQAKSTATAEKRRPVDLSIPSETGGKVLGTGLDRRHQNARAPNGPPRLPFARCPSIRPEKTRNDSSGYRPSGTFAYGLIFAPGISINKWEGSIEVIFLCMNCA
jgi:hypothetical protein